MRPCGEETSLSCSQEVKLATEGRREGQWCLGNKWRGVLEPCCRGIRAVKTGGTDEPLRIGSCRISGSFRLMSSCLEPSLGWLIWSLASLY